MAKYLSNIDLNKNQLQNATLHPVATTPTSPAEGQVYFDTTVGDKKMYYWNGTSWVFMGSQGDITEVQSSTTSQLTVTNGTGPIPSLAIVTGAVANGGTALATGDQIYDFVVGQGYVESVGVNNSTFINLVDSGTATDPDLTASLSATGTPSATVFLRGDNTWATPDYYTNSDVDAHLNTGTATSGQVLSWTGTDYDWIDAQSGDITSVTAGTYLNGGGSSGDVTLNHDTTSRTDTTSNASPAHGGTFTAVDSVTTNATGHVTAINVKTVTLPADDDTTYDLSGFGTTNGTAGIQLVGSDATTDQVDINGSGTTTVTHSGNVITITSNDQYDGTVTSVGTGNSAFISGSGGPITGSGSLTYSLSASGTPSGSTYLRGDNTWATLPADNDNYVDSISFSTVTGVLTLGRTGALSDLTQSLDGRYLTGNETITLSGDVSGSGTTSITTTIGAGKVDYGMLNQAWIVTEAEGIASNDNDTTIPTSAAVKDYVDSSIVGGLVYQGGYNAATNTPDLDSSPSASIKQGWTYTVTADGSFFTEQVRVGDVLIAETDAPTTLADWTTVQNNIDLASTTTVGIASFSSDNFAVSAAGQVTIKDNGVILGTETTGNYVATIGEGAGIDVTGSGSESAAVTVTLDLNELTVGAGSTLSHLAGNDSGGSTRKFTISDIADQVLGTNSYAATIADTATVTHSLSSNDVMVQLYDTVTLETVYADVERSSVNAVDITFAATPTNSIRVLIQKIG